MTASEPERLSEIEAVFGRKYNELGAQMDSAKLHDWLQIIGAAAIVASLIFVGLELRTSRATAESQVADGIAEGFLDLNVAVVTDTTLACIWGVGLEAPERLTDTQAGRFSMFMRGVFNQYFRVQSLYETGLVPESYWENVATTATWLIATPGGQLFFSSNAVPQDFADAIRPYEGVPQDFMLGREIPSNCPER